MLILFQFFVPILIFSISKPCAITIHFRIQRRDSLNLKIQALLAVKKGCKGSWQSAFCRVAGVGSATSCCCEMESCSYECAGFLKAMLEKIPANEWMLLGV